ncbi:hypothetical protein [Halorubrum sp. Ib24]|uniref:hypothetical protein n=1 Tax=Halorubrum sp. Ib24 TaxID=1383850 RepID=UPI0011798DA4|nr:hypothetical protein [Halorubrum sp. Ib24]
MYHPTPYYWTVDGSLSHIFYDNHLHPSTEFGWSSLCEAVRLPIEGEHFELNENVSEDNISCKCCKRNFDETFVDDDSTGIVNGCLVQFNNNNGEILQASKVCGRALHHSLPFQPSSFTGNLEEQVEEVCTECWETYVDHQWIGDDEGGEWRVEVCGDNSRSKYVTPSLEKIWIAGEIGLRLVSENGLEKDIRREEIESISLTPIRNVTY